MPRKCWKKITKPILTKWNNIKPIVSLTTVRIDNEEWNCFYRINSVILDGRGNISQIFERIVDLWNTNLWRRSNQILKSNRYYSSDQGTSMLAEHLKNTLLSSFDINQPEYVNPKSTTEENQSTLKLLLKTFIPG